MPRLVFGISNNSDEAKTEEYDSLSMKYLSYILYPLCLGGAFYSLYYSSHRRYFSFINDLKIYIFQYNFIFTAGTHGVFRAL